MFDGPIPRILDDVLDWAAQAFATRVESGTDGRVFDVAEYPLAAVRELVANALVHRDLDAWSEGMAIEVRHREDRLVVANPDGLYGIAADRLGREHVTSARNGALVGICQNVRSSDRDARVIEALATGIPTVLRSLRSAGMPPPTFHDQGIRFTVILRAASLPQPAGPALTAAERRVYDALLAGTATVHRLEQQLDRKAPTIRKVLRSLRDKGLVVQRGGRGRETVYEVSPG